MGEHNKEKTGDRLLIEGVNGNPSVSVDYWAQVEFGRLDVLAEAVRRYNRYTKRDSLSAVEPTYFKFINGTKGEISKEDVVKLFVEGIQKKMINDRNPNKDN